MTFSILILGQEIIVHASSRASRKLRVPTHQPPTSSRACGREARWERVESRSASGAAKVPGCGPRLRHETVKAALAGHKLVSLLFSGQNGSDTIFPRGENGDGGEKGGNGEIQTERTGHSRFRA